jgi:hypothetical protein
MEPARDRLMRAEERAGAGRRRALAKPRAVRASARPRRSGLATIESASSRPDRASALTLAVM